MSRAWLTLAIAPGLNAADLRRLLERFGSAEALTGARSAQLRAAGIGEQAAQALLDPDAAVLDRCLAWAAASPAHHLVSWADPAYPPLLAQVSDPPVVLFVRGDPAALSQPQLAIVGSRSASPGGEATARAFAEHLAGCGLAITSGLALGIDAAAHRGALACGGTTVAVLGTGPEQVYPRQHEELAAQVAAQGALVSEFAPGTPVRRANFPQRNRIISGLAAGTLVVEASIQSGALVTARCAAEQGREVFAIPGSIHNPLAKGCHKLIRDGAKLVETAGHILVELPGLLSADSTAVAPREPGDDSARAMQHDGDYARLLDAMSWDTVDVNTLAERSGLTAAEVSSMLLILELQGHVRPLAGGRFQRQRG
jgi:DNA processing protein